MIKHNCNYVGDIYSNLKPFVKWVGGKRDVIKKHLHKLLPESFNEYYEPFVGGGAMFLYLKPSTAYVNDINKELMTTYEQIKQNHKSLINKLDEYKKNHCEDEYYIIREKKPSNKLETAARFIYLNKTCFNGVYRVNSKGKFNVPFNGKTISNLNLYDKDNFINLSKYFSKNKIHFSCEDYLSFLDKPNRGDFVFVDSPYDYEDNINGFVSYNKKGFDKQDQINLANKLIELDKNGVLFMATNNKTSLVCNLYKCFKIREIKTNRNVNSNGKNRKDVATEVVITNY